MATFVDVRISVSTINAISTHDYIILSTRRLPHLFVCTATVEHAILCLARNADHDMKESQVPLSQLLPPFVADREKSRDTPVSKFSTFYSCSLNCG